MFNGLGRRGLFSKTVFKGKALSVEFNRKLTSFEKEKAQTHSLLLSVISESENPPTFRPLCSIHPDILKEQERLIRSAESRTHQESR